MPLDLKVIYLACNLKLCCINDTSNLATEALHSPSISLNKWASPKNKWKWQGIGKISDTGQHCKEYIITKYVVCFVVLVLCFVVRYFMFILVLQSSWWGQESWLLCLICLSGVSWWLSGSSSRCHGSAVCDCGISQSYSLTIFGMQMGWFLLFLIKSPCWQKPLIKFLLKRIYGLEEDVGWRIPRWLFYAGPSLTS